MRRLVAMVSAAACAAPVAASVVVDMPPPPKRAAAATATVTERARPAEPTVGELALARYGGDRSVPDSDFAWGDLVPAWWGGGYRISLSPWMYYGERNWQGAYVFPDWLP
ncbi:MAG: hypothetical protein GY715_06215 [Planctomycetes bacterium]|nr:hypothetical protein [Planctomycetota bacterium]